MRLSALAVRSGRRGVFPATVAVRWKNEAAFSGGRGRRKAAKEFDAFRVRVWHQLRSAGEGVSALQGKDAALLRALEKEQRLEWSLERHTADARIMRELIKYAVARQARYTAEKDFGAVAQTLGWSDASQTACFELLKKLRVFTPDTNPCVIRMGRPLFFPEHVLQCADQLLQKHVDGTLTDADARIRRDWRHVPIFTIDDAMATEIDDAVTLWSDEHGKEWIAVVVADPSSVMEPWGALEKYTRERASSVFLPERHYPMMPHSISTTIFSLNPKQETRGLCFAFRLSGGGALQETQIFPVMVQNIHKISYNAVDRMLRYKGKGKGGKGSAATAEAAAQHGRQKTPAIVPEHASVLRRLKEYADLRSKYRQKKGGKRIAMPKPVVRVQNAERPNISIVSQSSPARDLIEEMMVAAGECAAQFAMERKIPIPFRVQDKDLSVNPQKVPPPPKGVSPKYRRLYQTITSLYAAAPAFLDSVPRRHVSMGLDAYTQVTSPIRRYPDMMTHYQLKAMLHGTQPPFSSWDIMEYRAHHEKTMRSIESLQRESELYWTMVHMQKEENRGRHWEALMLPGAPEVVGERPKILAGEVLPVYLPEVGVRQWMKLRHNRIPGEATHVQVSEIDPVRGYMELTEV